MDFEDADLCEAGEGLLGGESDVGFDFAVLVGYVDGADARGEGMGDVLLEEALVAGAFGAANDGEGAVGDGGQHVWGDGPVVVG